MFMVKVMDRIMVRVKFMLIVLGLRLVLGLGLRF